MLRGLYLLFDIVGVVLEEMVAVPIVIENHLFEYLNQVSVSVCVSFFDCLQLGFHYCNLYIFKLGQSHTINHSVEMLGAAFPSSRESSQVLKMGPKI